MSNDDTPKPPVMNRNELIEATMAWVMGKLMYECLPGRLYHDQFKNVDGTFRYNEFHQFSNGVHRTVYLYLRGQKSLDGTCSDMECTLASQAKYVFGLYPAVQSN